jgi:tocopherol cyclase
MVSFIQNTLNPAQYQGRGKKAPYFEGWYFKLVNKDATERWAIIPGLFIGEKSGETHTFIQVLDGTRGTSTYHTYGNIHALPNHFNVHIGTSDFSDDRISLNIDDGDTQITGDVYLEGLSPWPVTVTSPGFMGPYAWLNMECKHAVLSFSHALNGSLTINGREIDFTGGRGYLEKDWGQAFPTSYIWMQTNHFATNGTSLSGSIATIPGYGPIRRPFTGFVVGFLHAGTLYRFATYTGAKIDHLTVTDDKIEWVLYTNDQELKIQASRTDSTPLKAPSREGMQRRVDETLTAKIEVELNAIEGTRKNQIFKGESGNSGLEVVGDLGSILKA